MLAVGANIATLAAGWGSFTTRLKSLEQKVDKHNQLVERMYKCENRLDLAERDITEIKGE